MKIKLINLIIDNFRCIRHFEVNANGENTYIQGKNGTGKTTVYDCFLWVLFGKNSLGESNFSVRPNNAPNEIEPSVTALFEVDGIKKEFKKVLASKFSRDTGEFRESVTECYINGVPKKIREYEREISELIDESIFKLLTNSRHFNENISWKDRRKILFEVCGSMTEIDVCNTDDEFKPLVDKLGIFGSAEEYKKSLTTDKKKISERINDIPSRIDEVYKQIDTRIDKAEEQAKLDTLNAQHSNLLDEYNMLKNGTSNTIAKQIQGEETKLFELEKANREFITSQSSDYTQKNAEWQNKYQSIKQQINAFQEKIDVLNNRISSLNKNIQQVRVECKTLNAEQWQGNEICPTCEQRLPVETVEKAKAKFNVDKSNKLEGLKEKAEKYKQEIDNFTSELANATKSKDKLLKEIELLEKDKPVLNETASMPNFNEEKQAIENEINNLLAEKEKSNFSIAEKLQAIGTQGQLIKEQIKEVNLRIAKADMNSQLEKRLEELKSEQALLRNKQGENLKMLDILDKFIKAKVSKIEDSINSKFKIARFKLFEQNKTNDSVSECCEVICNNAPRHGDVNNAGKTMVGIDIIQTLAQHYEKIVPIFIDNVEHLDSDNINSLISDVEQQVITLKVSDDIQLIIKEG